MIRIPAPFSCVGYVNDVIVFVFPELIIVPADLAETHSVQYTYPPLLALHIYSVQVVTIAIGGRVVVVVVVGAAVVVVVVGAAVVVVVVGAAVVVVVVVGAAVVVVVVVGAAVVVVVVVVVVVTKA